MIRPSGFHIRHQPMSFSSQKTMWRFSILRYLSGIVYYDIAGVKVIRIGKILYTKLHIYIILPQQGLMPEAFRCCTMVRTLR